MTIFAKGCDCSWGRPSVAGLRAAGYGFVVRYVYPESQAAGGKNLTKVEADGYRAAGLHLVSVFESDANRAGDGAAAGVADAKAAQAQHVACGGGGSDPIYFAVDFAANPAAVASYFAGVASVIGVARTGVYGDYDVVKSLLDRKAVRYGWQTYAWSHGLYDERSVLAQDRNGLTVGGAAVDYDTAHAADFGQWGGRVATVPPAHVPPPVKPPAKPGPPVVYVVQRGDTLTGIAQRYRTTVAALVRANRIPNPNLIYVGQRITIPGATPVKASAPVYVVRAGDTLSGIAVAYRTTWQRLAAVNGLHNPNLIFIGQKITIR